MQIGMAGSCFPPLISNLFPVSCMCRWVGGVGCHVMPPPLPLPPLMCRWVGGVGCHVTFTWHWEKLGLEGSGDGELLLQVRGSKGGLGQTVEGGAALSEGSGDE